MSDDGQAELEGLVDLEARRLIGDIDGRTSELEDAVGTILGVLEQADEGGPFDWEAMTDERRRVVMGQVAEFVDWLHDRYASDFPDLFQIPPCWWRHSGVVSLLTALWSAKVAVYNKKETRHSSSRVEFHERAFFPTMERVARAMKNCKSADGHNTDRVSPKRPDREAQLTEYISELPAKEAGNDEQR